MIFLVLCRKTSQKLYKFLGFNMVYLKISILKMYLYYNIANLL